MHDEDYGGNIQHERKNGKEDEILIIYCYI